MSKEGYSTVEHSMRKIKTGQLGKEPSQFDNLPLSPLETFREPSKDESATQRKVTTLGSSMISHQEQSVSYNTNNKVNFTYQYAV